MGYVNRRQAVSLSDFMEYTTTTTLVLYELVSVVEFFEFVPAGGRQLK